MPAPSPTDLAARVGALERIYETYLAWAGIILSSLTLVIIVAGFFSFMYIQREAKRVAQRVAQIEARQTAGDVAEARIANYLNSEAPRILRETVDLQSLSTSSTRGDDIMEASDDDSDDNKDP